MADSFIPSRRTSMRRIPWQRQQIALGQRSISLIMPFSQAWRFHHDYGHNNNDSCVPNQSNVRAPITLISRQLWLVSDWLSNENCCLITRWPSIFKIMITMFRHRRRLRWKSPITWSRQLPGNPPSASPESVWILMSFPLEICGFLGILYKDLSKKNNCINEIWLIDWQTGRNAGISAASRRFRPVSATPSIVLERSAQPVASPAAQVSVSIRNPLRRARGTHRRQGISSQTKSHSAIPCPSPGGLLLLARRIMKLYGLPSGCFAIPRVEIHLWVDEWLEVKVDGFS